MPWLRSWTYQFTSSDCRQWWREQMSVLLDRHQAEEDDWRLVYNGAMTLGEFVDNYPCECTEKLVDQLPERDCDCCGEIFTNYIAKTFGWGSTERIFYLCRDCDSHAMMCQMCGKGVINRDGREPCVSCNTPRCRTCGIVDNNLEETGECYECYRTFTMTNPLKFTVDEKVEKKHDKMPFLGIEWEFEVNSSRKLLVENLVSRGLEVPIQAFKQDGSLEHGIEVCFQPMSFRWFRKNREKVRNFVDAVADLGGYAEETCGIHIHISRDAFTGWHLYRFIQLCFNSVRQVQDVAGRGDTTYARFREEATLDKAAIRKVKQNCNLTGGRYCGVNLESNCNTVELRMFSSTDYPKQFLKRVELAMALFEFTKDASLRDLEWFIFRDWVLDRNEQYPYLSDYI